VLKPSDLHPIRAREGEGDGLGMAARLVAVARVEVAGVGFEVALDYLGRELVRRQPPLAGQRSKFVYSFEGHRLSPAAKRYWHSAAGTHPRERGRVTGRCHALLAGAAPLLRIFATVRALLLALDLNDPRPTVRYDEVIAIEEPGDLRAVTVVGIGPPAAGGREGPCRRRPFDSPNCSCATRVPVLPQLFGRDPEIREIRIPVEPLHERVLSGIPEVDEAGAV
jgi:hypothetical protein